MALPTTRDSAVSPCFHGCPALEFPTTVSSLTSPRSVSPQSTAALALDCSRIPQLQLPAAASARGPASLSRVCMAVARTVWFSFHLGCHRSALLLSALNISCLTQTIAPMCGSDPASFPPPTEGRSSPSDTPVFPPSSRMDLYMCVCVGGSIYSFTLVRSSCPLSAGVLRALLCLKVYSWCIHGERCTPCPPTPPPSCSLLSLFWF